MWTRPLSLPEVFCSTLQSISGQVSRAWWVWACGALTQEFGGPYCPPEGVPMDGEGQGCLVWQLNMQGLLVTRGPSRGPNYTALDSNTPRFQPPSLRAVVPLEKRVCLRGETRRGEAGPRTKDDTRASTVLHGSSYILLAFLFSLFFSLGVRPFWGRDGGQGADMMDGTGRHGPYRGSMGTTGMEGPSVVLPVWEERARRGVALGGRWGCGAFWGIVNGNEGRVPATYGRVHMNAEAWCCGKGAESTC